LVELRTWLGASVGIEQANPLQKDGMKSLAQLNNLTSTHKISKKSSRL
jgi:hypothetical protein